MYKSKDFARCLYNPLDESLFDEAERLQDIKMSYGATDKMLRYIIILYDPNTPIKREYPDLDNRKIMAASLAGYDDVRDKTSLIDLFSCKSDIVSDSIIAFLKIVNSRIWAQICSTEQTIWEYNKRLLQPIDKAGEDEKQKDEIVALNLKSKMSEDLDSMNARLDILEKKFYGDDESLREAVTKVQRMSSESVAKALKRV